MKNFFDLRKEHKPKTAVFTYARMNPPTRAHQKLLNHIMSTSVLEDGTPFLFLSKKEDLNKNPLSYKEKVKYVKLGLEYSEIILKDEDSITSAYLAVKYLIDQKYERIIAIVGSDRIESFQFIKDNINNDILFEIRSIGDRTKNVAAGILNVSSSKMRNFVINDNIEQFMLDCPVKLSTKYCKEMFDLLKLRLKK